MKREEHECPDCKKPTTVVVQLQTGSCAEGCCPSYLKIAQCPYCKRIFEL